MVWYRTSSHAHRSPQTYMACVARCGMGHQAMHIVHLKPTWCVWHGVVWDIKPCTSFTSNLHGVCGTVWYRTSSHAHRSPQTYMVCVARCGMGHYVLIYKGKRGKVARKNWRRGGGWGKNTLVSVQFFFFLLFFFVGVPTRSNFLPRPLPLGKRTAAYCCSPSYCV